jgi:hypothetical protein
VGNDADLILIDDTAKLFSTWIAGTEVYSSGELGTD